MLVFTPIELPDGVRGEVLTECRAPTLYRELSGLLPSVDTWRPWLAQLVADPSALPGYATLKYSKSGEVFRARFAGRHDQPLDVVCRFSRSDGGGTSFLKRPSRAQRTLRRAVRLLHVGIDTAIPLARIERTSPPRLSWLVTEFVADAVDLDQIVLTLLSQLDQTALHEVKTRVLTALVELFASLERAGLYHRDLKASNILLTNWDSVEEAARPMLVDLDGLHHRRWWSRRRQWQPLTRLAASLRDYPTLTRTDFARFLHRYLPRVGLPTAEWKAHFRRIARNATDYAQRSQLRKAHKLDGFTGA